ncbi:1,4-dihydroxy-2-naphthoate octaprenyltransferase [Galbibacter marinus]|uniref:1,4-dihydroxy-2-naphthoate octaprenyltransferase n=1 Tax=Galbibacter marinus TaxID=555500 RepID=K2PX73_9FLAO|nr:1,4-dihydroxy-2-naphthoate octaprenyltransferase [Galbibacter marinus]EKF56079.1 1,4-dihydroxy-2-naphthoate octaprenyltransferase [Galbibacter marinus]
MTKLKTLIEAARLRTLPLSVSGIIVGSAIAFAEGLFNPYIFVLALVTTVGFQVLSNFANDYGDGVKGTDNEDRVGPVRALQSGIISAREMLYAMIVTTILTMIVAIALIYTSFGGEQLLFSLLFFVLGLFAVAAAIKYTVGSSAYGYHGYGDLFVFIFFGLVSVIGSYFLYAKKMEWDVILPAVSVGLLSVGVLNLNNMRDVQSDAKSNKNTMVVNLGIAKAKKYHTLIILVGLTTAVLFLVLNYQHWTNVIFIISFIPIILHLKRVRSIEHEQLLDPELKKLSLSTFLFAVLFLFSYNNFL